MDLENSRTDFLRRLGSANEKSSSSFQLILLYLVPSATIVATTDWFENWKILFLIAAQRWDKVGELE